MDDIATKMIQFLRQYGPIARADNMYDEHIQRAAARLTMHPLEFDHPLLPDVRQCFTLERPPSVILTGTAGDGKTHICRQIWIEHGGDANEWDADSQYYFHNLISPSGRCIGLHIIRDWSAWVPQRDADWSNDKLDLLERFCRSMYQSDCSEIFLIAANDGQLMDSWRRLPDEGLFKQVHGVLESLLVEDRQHLDGTFLHMFNLSRGSSAELFDLVLNAFLKHEAWTEAFAGEHGPDEAFGARCPIRHNYTLLQKPLVQKRLRMLFELCDYNDLHVPIREILLFLINAVLGHPDVNEGLMVPSDIPRLIQEDRISRASFYNNAFGGNLAGRRESLTIFEYFDRFRIGDETSNRIDNILIFGDADPSVRPYFDQLLVDDEFYGATPGFRGLQRRYVERTDKDESAIAAFLDQLVVQRRGLFFKIPEEQENELGLWNLTVFKYAGDYLQKVIRPLKAQRPVEQHIRTRLVKGLNRIFVGMLVDSDRELFLADSLSVTSARVNRLLDERISVQPHLGERVEIIMSDNIPVLNVVLAQGQICSLTLYLTRFEYLCRVAEGALPNSFSKECYEDMLAFKSQISAGVAYRRRQEEVQMPFAFKLLVLDEHGHPQEEVIELLEREND